MRVLATGLSMLGLASSALGQVIPGAIHVDVNQTSNPPNGLDWDHAFPDLQDGIDAALADPTRDHVVVAEGTYLPSDVWDLVWSQDNGCLENTNNDPRTVTIQVRGLGFGQSLSLHGGFLGTETKDVDSPEGRFNQTILSGDIGTKDFDLDNAYHVVLLDSPNADLVALDGFRVTDGRADRPELSSNVIFSDLGGGVLVLNTNCLLTNLRVRENHAAGGGGVLCTGGAVGGDGVVCRPEQAMSATVTRSVFRDNEAQSNGGGLFFGRRVTVGLGNLKVFDNTATAAGGGVYKTGVGEATDEEKLTGYNLVMYDNTAAVGGAMRIDNGVTTNLDQCTIAYNGISGPGVQAGGIDLDAGAPSTVFRIDNSILYFNGGTGDVAVNSLHATSIAEANFCDIRAFTGSLSEASGPFTAPGPNPLFVDGPGRNLKLLGAVPPGGSPSPCIDAGSTGLRPKDLFDVDEDGAGEDLDVDLDLGPRLLGSSLDMGCYEVLSAIGT